ncbi:hypothetical protein Rleg4DRAFT_2482 [Rhizobium leguminosarum bv. trifolii WSM2297]|uniref:TniQ domain-containing protein n=1 Tax=Rhizobium leguminosarum bv. trifolii WSM2297 TaxID=754762 RepID=J0W6N2_RHILT|nr:TniQ family protein [Rhizobium leguminosarum]EJC80818.1 hypothetical protein Rleg4DRAFT_2482 [Rhizobium leguminosarum bv. trifolii WSM2297]
MVLPVPVTHVNGIEDPVSFASRLSAANGYRSLKSLLASGGTNVTDLAKGDPEALAKLARWSGAAPDHLAELAIVSSKDHNTWRIGEAVFNKDMRRGNRFRYCPTCIVDDVSHGKEHPAARPYVRAQWLTKAVVNCSQHHRPLVEVDFPNHHEHDFARYVANNLPAIEHVAKEDFEAQSISVDLYAENRIKGIYREQYLDRFPAYVAIDLPTYLGRLLKRNDATWALVPAELRDASLREIGFHFARQGAEVIRQLVTTFIRAKRPDGGEKFLFGHLGRWLRSNSSKPEYAELVELFQDVAERNLPFGPGDFCFVPVRKRYLHSIKTASAQYGLVEKRVIRLLRDAGCIGDEKLHYSRIHFDAEKAHGILMNAAETLTSRQVRLELAVTEEFMADLLESGLLPTVEARPDIRKFSRIRREDLTEFKRSIVAASTCSNADEGMGTIFEVSQKCGCRAHEVLAIVLKGGLSKVSAPKIDHFKIHGVVVDIDEAVRLVVGNRESAFQRDHAGYVSVEDARVILRVKPLTIKYLLQHGLLSLSKISSPVSSRSKEFITLASLEAFQSEYVTLGELSTRYATHAIAVTNALEKIGVKPSPERAGAVTRFYRRVEVENVIINAPSRKRS